MGQECPRCRLFSPDEALRCDCGYEFATGTMKESYLAAHIIEKEGGLQAILANAARKNIRTGTALLLMSGALSGVVSLFAPQEPLENGRGTYFVFLGGFTLGAILLIKGLNQRRFLRIPTVPSPRSSDRSAAPDAGGYHAWLGELNANPLGLGIPGVAVAFAGVPATLVFAILGLMLFPEGWYPRFLLGLPGILAGGLVTYVLGFLAYKLPVVGIAACGLIGSMCIWVLLFWARTYQIWP